MARMEGALPDFLRKHKVYAIFVSNLRRQYMRSFTTRDYFSKFTGESAVRIAFDWTKADEGWKFWEDIDALWRER